ncbi:MAG TPA: heparinase II/III-family protein, partial [Candidatus Binatia bacterium]
ELLWLLGAPGLKTYQALDPLPPKAAPSRVFTDGGYAVMRSDWGRDAHQMIFDAGPVSAPKSGHGHADLLGIQCSVFGEPYIVDPGTYVYTGKPEWREFFRGTSAHSTVTIDGRSQATAAGSFNWKTQPAARLTRWLSTKAFDYAAAEHDAYRDLADPVTHRRRVAFVKPRYWAIVDDLDGAAEHRIALRFQFAALRVALEPNHWARARGERGHALLVRPFAAAPLTMDVIEGLRAPIQGWVSPAYGQRQPAPVLICSAAARLPLRIVTLLYPVEDPSAACPEVSQLLGPAGPAGLIFRERGERLIFRDRDIALVERE